MALSAPLITRCGVTVRVPSGMAFTMMFPPTRRRAYHSAGGHERPTTAWTKDTEDGHAARREESQHVLAWRQALDEVGGDDRRTGARQYRLNRRSASPIDLVSLMSGTIFVSFSSYWRSRPSTATRDSFGTTTTPVLSATIQSPGRTSTPPHITGTLRATGT